MKDSYREEYILSRSHLLGGKNSGELLYNKIDDKVWN